MGDCRHVIEQIETYLDGELAAEVRAEVHAHVEGCPPCAERTAFQVRLREMLRSACGPCALPPQLEARVRAFLDDASL